MLDKSPCLECEYKNNDKRQEPCAFCDKPAEYSLSLGNNTSSLPMKVKTIIRSQTMPAAANTPEVNNQRCVCCHVVKDIHKFAPHYKTGLPKKRCIECEDKYDLPHKKSLPKPPEKSVKAIQSVTPVKPSSALERQVGGNHYKDCVIQPYEFFIKNNIPHHKAAIIRRILRYDHPTGKGREDLEKIRHELDLIIEIQGW